MRILKEYWAFDENSILKPYQLGQVIDFEKESENLKESTEGDYDYEYIGNNMYLWVVSIKNNIVIRVIYKSNFPIPNFYFWDNHYDKVRNYLSKKFRLVDKDYSEDRMCIIVKDGFTSLIILQKGHENWK